MRKMKQLTRRSFLRGASKLCLGLAGAAALGGCAAKVVEVERVVEKEVTKIVTEIVRETIVVEPTPQVVEKSVETKVEKVITVTPAPQPKVTLIADVTNSSWTHFAMLVTPTFEEMFPNLTIRWRRLSNWDEYPARIKVSQVSGQLGDLLEAPPGALLIQWAEGEIIQSLDDIIRNDGFDTSGILGGVLRAFRYQDKQMGLPFIGSAGENLLLYNKNPFDEQGIDYPDLSWSLDDLVEAADALTMRGSDGRVGRFGYAIRYRLPDAYPMLHLFDAHLISADGQTSSVDGQNGVECLRWAHDLIHVAQVSPSLSQIEGGLLEMFCDGKLAMLRHDLGSLIDLGRALPDAQEVGSVLYPKHPSTGRVGASASGMAYCIGRNTELPYEAFRWLKFMASREMGVQMFLGGYAPPGCRAASWEDPRVVDLFPVCAQVADGADMAEPPRLPSNLRVQECQDIWNREIGPLWLGEVTPEECAANIADQVNRVLVLPPDRSV
ncbi:MAG: hypothetical protein A2Y73_00015 [Chloroflexi bacterium RBG_13_56_8]|nr:MAG: hypothetical protein A2Y73_00015 [Chloroflexi bacterium RBG_13_56_8]